MPVLPYHAGLQVPICAVFVLYDTARSNGYLSHVGLADDDQTLDADTALWFHIWPGGANQPPFYGGDHVFGPPDLIGFIGDLTADEHNRLLTSKSYMDTLGSVDPVGYIDEHHPAIDERHVLGRVCYRFTCVGVVLKCYADAKIPLLDVANTVFPTVRLEGHTGGRLPYVAAGYVFHALARPPAASRNAQGGYRPHLPSSLREACYLP